VHDLDGNVAEWVEDCWHDSYLRAPDDASAWVNPGCARHVVRGGSWGSAPEQFRSAYRASAPSELRSGRTGFRVVRDLGQATDQNARPLSRSPSPSLDAAMSGDPLGKVWTGPSRTYPDLP
jgi:hypothetical protein